MNEINIINECISYPEEKEWFEIKENWFSKDEIGEYISALSNSAAILGRKEAYIIWGIKDKNHKPVGTTLNYDREYGGEPYIHYLSRKLEPRIGFSFNEVSYKNKRLVLLKIDSAKVVPTAFDDVRYIRIGSSKEKIKKYPAVESKLFTYLTFGIPTVVNTKCDYQNLNFSQLKDYYSSHKLKINSKTFEMNLNFKTEKDQYNILAQLLSDDSHVPIRFAIFSGKTKASKLYSVKEFGYKCLIYSLNEVLEYGKILNIPQVDETNRVMVRNETPLFNYDAFREAIINAFLHNKWVDKNEPMISMFSDRIEIFSRGGLAPLQTIEGFYVGHSVPVNEKLSEIFLQLHISEKTGRGVPTILEKYGKKSIKFSNDGITVIIPFDKKSMMGDKVGDKMGDKVGDKVILSSTQIRVLAEIKNNGHITKPVLCKTLSLSKTSIDNAISFLRKNRYINRVGSNKTGYWEIIK